MNKPWSKNWEGIIKEWCKCWGRENGYSGEAYDFHIPPNTVCPLCKVSINENHCHCTLCCKVVQVEL